MALTGHIAPVTIVATSCDFERRASVVSSAVPVKTGEKTMSELLRLLHQVWSDDAGQDVAEYAVMLAVILVIVVGTIKIIGGKSNNVFSEVASSIQ
jgi:Flp pilus assembly pilin Flp